MRCWRQACLALLFLGGAAGQSAQAAQPTPGEYELKAAFIARFTEFIDWPDAVPNGAAFKLCVLGAHPIEEALAKLPALIRPNHRPLQVRRIEGAEAAKLCDLVFIPRAAAQLMHAVHKAADKRPVLTVSEAPGQLQQGAMLNFFTEGERLRFEVNLPEVQESGLQISSRLLKLATVMQ